MIFLGALLFPLLFLSRVFADLLHQVRHDGLSALGELASQNCLGTLAGILGLMPVACLGSLLLPPPLAALRGVDGRPALLGHTWRGHRLKACPEVLLILVLGHNMLGDRASSQMETGFAATAVSNGLTSSIEDNWFPT